MMWNKIKEYIYSVIKGSRRGFAASIVKIVLSIFSFVYFLLIECRAILYNLKIARAYSLPRPVVSVGNITVGGTGKTPLVEAISRIYAGKNIRPCILMRGYGADEDKMLKENIPGLSVCSGKDRVSSAKNFLVNNEADIFILDDGFQHRRIKRDLDIVTIDAANPFGSRRLLPRGILREPLKNLSRGDIFVITKSDLAKSADLDRLKKEISSINKNAMIVESIHKPTGLYDLNSKKDIPLDSISGKKAASLCGIGSPSSFEMTIERLGASIALSYRFEDHHKYSNEEWESILNECENFYVDTIIMTQKDFVNMRNILNSPQPLAISRQLNILVLKMEIGFINNEKGLCDRLYSLSNR